MSSTQAIVKPSAQALIKQQLQSDGMVQALRDSAPVTARAYLTPERVVRIVTTAVSRTPKLLECEPQTLLRSVVDLVQLGLEPGGPLGHGYLVPFFNGKTKRMECQPIVGYQGYLALARRSGEIESVFVQVIFSRDKYRISYGDEPSIKHEPALMGERGVPVAAYCVAKFKSGGKHVEVMTKTDIDGVMARSKAKDFGTWQTDWEMMARKTVIRRARHYWPISVEMAQAAELDDRVDTGAYVDGGELEVAAAEPKTPKTARLAAKIKAQQEPPHDPQTGEVSEDRDYLDEQGALAAAEMGGPEE